MNKTKNSYALTLMAIVVALAAGGCSLVAPRSRPAALAEISPAPTVVWKGDIFEPDRDDEQRQLILDNWRAVVANPSLSGGILVHELSSEIGAETPKELPGKTLTLEQAVAFSRVASPRTLILYAGSWCPGTMTVRHFRLASRIAQRLRANLVIIDIDENQAGQMTPTAELVTALALSEVESPRDPSGRALQQMLGIAPWDAETEEFDFPKHLSRRKFVKGVRAGMVKGWLWSIFPGTPEMVFLDQGSVRGVFSGIIQPGAWGDQIEDGVGGFVKKLFASEKGDREALVTAPLTAEEEALAEALAERIAACLWGEPYCTGIESADQGGH